jgi:hypothetical protein
MNKIPKGLNSNHNNGFLRTQNPSPVIKNTTISPLTKTTPKMLKEITMRDNYAP